MPVVTAVTLAPRHALAFAHLLPLLGCGEEAAALAFDGLSTAASDPLAAAALAAIAAEERLHDGLIAGLIAALPPAPGAVATRRAARRFHINLGRDRPTVRLARIAATDAAVCTMLSRLLRPGRPLAAEPTVAPILARIHRDEARHVRQSRRLARVGGEAAMLRDVAGATRAALADVLRLGAAAFDALEVDPDQLDRDLRRLPTGLFA
jgi:hypothetical protein